MAAGVAVALAFPLALTAPVLPLPPPIPGPEEPPLGAAVADAIDWPLPTTPTLAVDATPDSVSFSGDDDGSLDPCSCAFVLTGLYGGIVLTLPPFF